MFKPRLTVSLFPVNMSVMRKRSILIVFFVTTAFAFDKPKPVASVKPIFTMSKETTVITGPLDIEGFPDYGFALNERLRGTIKPADNACVKLWEAIGPIPGKGKVDADSYWKWLNCEAPPAKGEYFIPVYQYFRKQGKKQFTDADYKLEAKLSCEPWSAIDHPQYAAWLIANQKPLAIIMGAVHRKSFFSPFSTRKDNQIGLDFESMRLNITTFREPGKALLSRAMLRTKQNQLDDAWKDIQTCHRLARHISNGGSNTDLLVGITLELMACQADLAFLEHGKPKGEMLVRYRNELDQLPPLSRAVDNLELAEHYMMLDLVSHVRREGIDAIDRLTLKIEPQIADPLPKTVLDKFNWSDTFRTVNIWHEHLVKVIRISDRHARKKAWIEFHNKLNLMSQELKVLEPRLKEDVREGKMEDSMGETIGKMLVANLVPVYPRIEEISEGAVQTMTMTRLAFALAAYHESKGTYPDKLDQLAPAFAKTLPLDIFSGKPPIYKKTEKGYLVYSVGPNEKDEDGRLFNDPIKAGERLGDDIGVRMPAKQP